MKELLKELTYNFHAATYYVQRAQSSLKQVLSALEKTGIIMPDPEDWNCVKDDLTEAEAYLVAFKANFFFEENTEIKVDNFYYHYNRFMGTNTYIGVVEEVLSLTNIVLPKKYQFYLHKLDEVLTETNEFCVGVIKEHYDLFARLDTEYYVRLD